MWQFCRRYIHNQAHAIWLGCIKIRYFYLTLSRVIVFFVDTLYILLAISTPHCIHA